MILSNGTRVKVYDRIGMIDSNDLENTEDIVDLNYYIIEESQEWPDYFMVRHDHVEVIECK